MEAEFSIGKKRFNNSISYNDSQQIIATIADSCEEQIQTNGIYIPPNLKKGIFIQCAIDNIDFTNLHATTVIVFQHLPGDEEIADVASVPLVKKQSVSVKDTIPFETTSSNLSLKDHKQARSLKDINLSFPRTPRS